MTAIQDVGALLLQIQDNTNAVTQKQKDLKDANQRRLDALAQTTQYRAELDQLLTDNTAALKALRDALVTAFGAAG